MARVRWPNRSTPSAATSKGTSEPKRPTVPEGLVLSATGGDAFFWSGMEIVHVPRTRHDVEGFYRLVGVSPDADDRTVAEAAKRLLMEAHPDHGGDEDEFMRAYAAYRALADPAARAEYDTRPSETAFSVQVALMPVQDEIAPLAPPQGARTAYYKEPDIIMSDEDEEEVDRWARYLLEAAQARRKSISVRVAIRKSVKNMYAREPGDVYTLQHGTRAEKYMAHVMMEFTTQTERETKCNH